MPDDLHIPALASGSMGRAPISSGYRPRRGNESSGRIMAIAAVAIGGVMLLGLGGWAVMGRRPAVVPLIEADTRPLRVKPENPGGMQVVGAEEQVLGGTGNGAERMAPSPEVPAPQALRAQMQQAAPTAPAPAAPSAPSAPAAPTAASPLPDTQPRPQPAARLAAPAATPRPGPAAGGTQVQLAAVETEAAAQAEWQRLARRMPELLNERRPTVQRAERDGHAVYRVRTGGFADMAEATSFCAKVKAKGASCTIASF